MKKLIAVLLVLSLLLCGCAADTSPVSGQVTPDAGEETRPLSLGRIEGGEYTNKYVGYGCRLSSSWTFYSADELQDLPADVAEAMSGSEMGDKLSQYTQISDMMAENVDDLATINVLYTKLGLQERLAYAMLSEKEILEEVLGQKDIMFESYAAAGIYATDMELVTVTFLGQERYAIHTTATMQDVPYFILQIYDYHLGSYGVVTTFASFIEDKTASLPELFYPLA